MISITLNGTSREVPSNTTVESIVREITTATQGIAVAVDESVVRRTDWANTVLQSGARVDVLTAVQGG
ncbi:unannotated protein [freshwater metagenome]|jgi:sulfur carrier protein|uniref:Unannotated protein n=1 Tax=freshwater metagenome TaxID=449393 RepID=A0A6J7BI71_9ZZZZ